MSPTDGDYIYVAAETSASAGVGDIAEFTRNADGSLTPVPNSNNCIAENATQTYVQAQESARQAGSHNPNHPTP